jgi:alanyl-tRNA synthetase
MLTSERVKTQFMNYYAALGHVCLSSGSLIPNDDPTLLFINSTMARFKNIYSGQDKPEIPMIATFQPCLRVGGKPTLYEMEHALENVGKGQSLTLFEQVGSCAFGAYSRSESIEYIWYFLTKELCLDKRHIWITVYERDEETFEIWEKLGIHKNQMVKLGENHWWKIEPVGVCGPCTHFVYDLGEAYGCGNAGCGPTCICGRFLDLGDCVFLEQICGADGKTHILPRLNIDCALGLERISIILENVSNIFEISSFRPMLCHIQDLSKNKYGLDLSKDAAMRAIVDHIRCLVFAISDGIYPANNDRGYVLRRVLRHAVRCGWILGLKEPFLYGLIDTVVSTMSDGYPLLEKSRNICGEVILEEEIKFIKALRRGDKEFYTIANKLKGEKRILSGSDIFKLYDTFGLPIEFVRTLATEYGLQLNEDAFKELLEEQREKSRKIWEKKVLLGSLPDSFQAG